MRSFNFFNFFNFLKLPISQKTFLPSSSYSMFEDPHRVMTTMPPPYRVHIVYCGGWGYGSRFHRVKRQIEMNCPNTIVTGEATENQSGKFEVVGGDGDNIVVFHSKVATNAFPPADLGPLFDAISKEGIAGGHTSQAEVLALRRKTAQPRPAQRQSSDCGCWFCIVC